MSAGNIDRESDIHLHVGLDKDNNPISLSWTADEGEMEPRREVKAMMLTLWDVKENNTMRIDLWNKDFMVEEMRTMVYQNLLSLADVLQRATQDEEAAEEMRRFGGRLAELLELTGGSKS